MRGYRRFELSVFWVGRLTAVWAALLAASLGASADPTETVLYSFTGGIDGAFSNFGVVFDASGAVYGTTEDGGGSPNCDGGCGIVFKLTPPTSGRGPWTRTVLYSFKGGNDGSAPNGPLIFGPSGALYGTTALGGSSGCPFGCGTVYKLTPPPGAGAPWIETVLSRFRGGSDGQFPFAGLVFDRSGALYGTTNTGGILSACGGSGCGTVFKLTPPVGRGTDWTRTILYSFRGGYVNGPDGAFPQQPLTLDRSGALYGTTSSGGPSGVGTVFRLTPQPRGGTPWVETVLHSFGASADDGNYPSGSLAFGADGALYGTTEFGGTPTCIEPRFCESFGTVYRLEPSQRGQTQWIETVLYSFTGGSGGAGPLAGVVSDRSGTLYGTTNSGGISSAGCNSGCGTVYKLAPPPGGKTPWIETTLYSFIGGNDGNGPSGGSLVADVNGNLYGTTSQGGGGICPSGNGCGTVFELAGAEFSVSAVFAGLPGRPNCRGQSVFALVREYGGLSAAAGALGLPSVKALQEAIRAFCRA